MNQNLKSDIKKILRKDWVEVGRVRVNPRNVLAVKTVQAAEHSHEVFTTERPFDEVEAVRLAVEKRARRAKKALQLLS